MQCLPLLGRKHGQVPAPEKDLGRAGLQRDSEIGRIFDLHLENAIDHTIGPADLNGYHVSCGLNIHPASQGLDLIER
jgi:hypothetical protein